MDPDPLVICTDLPIRFRTKMSRIPNTGLGITSSGVMGEYVQQDILGVFSVCVYSLQLYVLLKVKYFWSIITNYINVIVFSIYTSVLLGHCQITFIYFGLLSNYALLLRQSRIKLSFITMISFLKVVFLTTFNKNAKL
jgi:hypothetical protein